jgi:diamine N-acetyltransferase
MLALPRTVSHNHRNDWLRAARRSLVKIRLHKIDPRNLDAALELQFRDGQAEFVRSPARSIASAYVQEYGTRFNYERLAIHDADTMVGYAGLQCDPASDDDYWIGEIMIDGSRQRRGFGRAAMTAVVRHILDSYPRCRAVQLTCHRDNHNAAALYLSLGFVMTGKLNVDNGPPLYALSGAALDRYRT